MKLWEWPSGQKALYELTLSSIEPNFSPEAKRFFPSNAVELFLIYMSELERSSVVPQELDRYE